jgi:hypothetical protein
VPFVPPHAWKAEVSTKEVLMKRNEAFTIGNATTMPHLIILDSGD